MWHEKAAEEELFKKDKERMGRWKEVERSTTAVISQAYPPRWPPVDPLLHKKRGTRRGEEESTL